MAVVAVGTWADGELIPSDVPGGPTGPFNASLSHRRPH